MPRETICSTGSEPAITGVLRQLHLEAIAVHDPSHFIGWDEDVVLHPVDSQETVAGAVGAHDALNQAADGPMSPAPRAISTVCRTVCRRGTLICPRPGTA